MEKEGRTIDEPFRPTSAGKHSLFQLCFVIRVNHLLAINLSRFCGHKGVTSYIFYVQSTVENSRSKNERVFRFHKGDYSAKSFVKCRMSPSSASIKRVFSSLVNTERSKPSITKMES